MRLLHQKGYGVADLEFHGTIEERQRQGEAFMQRICADFYGNGRVGLMELTRSFIDGFVATEKQKEKHQQERHMENSEKLDMLNSKMSQRGLEVSRRSLIWTVAGVCVAAAGVIVAILAIVATVKLAHLTSLHQIPLFDHFSRVIASAHTSNADSFRPNW